MSTPKFLLPAAAIMLAISAVQAPQIAAQTKVYAQRIEMPGAPMTIDLSSDKAVYSPGEQVTLTASKTVEGARVRYRHGADFVGENHAMTSASWQWQPPVADFKGYLVEVYKPCESGGETILATIAVDVSSDWKRFPRYGFVATFDDSKRVQGTVEREMAYLNRCHINGVQFQDWHNKHHWPLGGTRDNLLTSYTDIANRTVYTSVVKRYIAVQHSYGMKSIFYNLCYGVLSDAATDGVDPSWYLFRSPSVSEENRDRHTLPSSWKSDIYLVNPANTGWQNYLAQRNDDVYHNFDFDGYQIDQLGYRGTLYDASRRSIDLPAGFTSFIKAMKNRHPDKRMIMNAVASYATSNIVASGCVDFCYNETWADEAQFTDLRNIIATNEANSNGSLRTVFASYMNYDKQSGQMNTPGVLLTDAVMMALGGSHLELGDHMLSSEYFPNTKLSMSAELKDAIVHYYDFMTAYQNLLRDNYSGSFASTEYDPRASYAGESSYITLNNWPPREGNITTYARRLNDKEIVHLLNFRSADNLSWRDLDGTRPEPQTIINIPVKIATQKSQVTRVWAATPDNRGGAPTLLPFERTTDGYIKVTVPSIKYWTMIVIE